MRIRQIGTIVLLLTVLSTTVAAAVAVGPPEPGAAPGSTSSYTLEDIYQRLDAGTAGTASTWAEPLTGPGDTMHTLNDIMGEAPAVDDTNGATAAQVLSGKTYWSVRSSGEWGPKTGTATVGSDVAGGEGEKTFNIPDGFYDGKTATANDSDLLAENIKCGVTIFGVTGSLFTEPDCVAKTGQTSVYGAGDDGTYQKGCSPAVVPVIGLSFGNYKRTSLPSYAACDPGFTDNGDGTVTDNLTGLIWLQQADCGGKKIWTDALTFANSLHDGWTGDGSGGDCELTDGSSVGDWRLANINELRSLFDPNLPNPYLPAGHPFDGVPTNDTFWSSTTAASRPSNAFVVSTKNGGVMNWVQKPYDFYVWPVRGGQ